MITIEQIRKIVPPSLAVVPEDGKWVVCKTDHNWRPIDTFDVAFDAGPGRLEELARWVGPREPGRPEIGPEVKVRLPEWAIEEIEEAAQGEGITRAAWIRHAVLDAVWAARRAGHEDV